MFGKPNYENPVTADYLELVNYEAFIVQCEEVLAANGHDDEVRCLKQERKLVRNRKICTKAALNEKSRLRQQATTLRAVAINWTEHKLIVKSKDEMAMYHKL